MNLYDQLLSLQVIEGAYEDWAAYRTALTDYILASSQGEKSLAILGAGSCNDLDIKRLSEVFEEIYLIDRSQQGMKSALEKYDLEDSPKIILKEQDFVGITAEQYRHYADTLVRKIRERGKQTHLDELAGVALSLLQAFKNQISQEELDLGSNCYDVVVAVGVHSQLISMLDWIWQIMMQTLGCEQSELAQMIRNEMIEMNSLCVERFDLALINAAKKQVITGLEMERVGRIGSVQGAIQAMQHFEALKEQVEKIKEAYVLWPFHVAQGVSYQMKIQSFKI